MNDKDKSKSFIGSAFLHAMKAPLKKPATKPAPKQPAPHYAAGDVGGKHKVVSYVGD